MSRDFHRKPTSQEEGNSRWYKYDEHISIVWCSDPGRSWSAFDFTHDKGTREYPSRAELTEALDNGTIEWM